LGHVLRSLGAIDARPPLDFVNFPSPVYVADTVVIRWLNPAGVQLVGNVIGRPAVDLVERRFHKELGVRFARMLIGTDAANDMELVIRGKQGMRIRGRVNSTPIRGRHGIVGTFGVVHVLELLDRRTRAEGRLTPREETVLHLLAAGRSTDDIGAELGLARATVRNHVQRLLRRLGAHSRIEAVALARAQGLIEN